MIAHPPGALIGRDADLDRVRELFGSGSRIVSLVGPPGVGKTRLARESMLRSDVPSLFCDLAVARASEDVLRLLATTLAVSGDEIRSQDLFGVVVRALAQQGAVTLVLDNAETVVSQSWPLFPRVLEAAPAAMFLVTSREPLRIAGEMCHRVGPLSEADSLALFLARMSARHPQSVAGGEELRALVARLEGIPLAIEIVAAQCGLYSVPQLDQHLSRRLNQLPNTTRGVPERHGSLEAAIDVSWQLFGAAERSVLAQCSVFRGGFTIESAEAVVQLAPGSAALSDVLVSLVDKSFLHARNGTPQRRLDLLESVRVFAAQQLAGSGEDVATHERFCRFMAEQGQRWTGDIRARDDDDARRALADEVDNLLEASERGEPWPDHSLRALLAAHEVLKDLVPASELLPRLDEVAERLAGQASPGVLAELAAARADLLAFAGRGEEALALALETIASSRQAGSPSTEAWAAFLAGRYFLWGERIGEAHPVLEKSLQLARAHDLPMVAARATLMFAVIESLRGHWERARMLCRQLLESARSLSSDALTCRVLLFQGQVDLHDGLLDEAEHAYQGALAIASARGWRWDEARARDELSICAFERGLFEDARAAGEAVLERAQGAAFIAENAMLHAGIFRHALGDLEGAAAAFSEAIELRRELIWGGGQAVACLHRGALEAERGRVEEAQAAFADAEDAAGASTREVAAVRPVLLGFLHLARAERAASGGDLADASRHLRVAMGCRDEPAADWIGWGRRARLLLGRAIDRSRPARIEREQHALAITRDLTWVRPPRGRRIHLPEASPQRRLLARLVEERQRHPGRAIPAPELGAAAWPDEAIPDRLRRERVKVAIYSLRGRGFSGLVMSQEGGYLLDPDVPLAVVESSANDPPDEPKAA